MNYGLFKVCNGAYEPTLLRRKEFMLLLRSSMLFHIDAQGEL
jgi:hypothetical protein